MVKNIGDVRINESSLSPYVETVNLGMGGGEKPHILVFKLIPFPQKMVDQNKLQVYEGDKYISVRIGYMGAFTSEGKQTIAYSYVPPNCDLTTGPILQDSLGYIRVNKAQLSIVQEIYKRGDYLGIKGWTHDVYMGMDTKGYPMLILNLQNKPGVQLVAVPGINHIPPLPKPDKRTSLYQQSQGPKERTGEKTKDTKIINLATSNGNTISSSSPISSSAGGKKIVRGSRLNNVGEDKSDWPF